MYILILFLSALSLWCCAGAFSSGGARASQRRASLIQSMGCRHEDFSGCGFSFCGLSGRGFRVVASAAVASAVVASAVMVPVVLASAVVDSVIMAPGSWPQRSWLQLSWPQRSWLQGRGSQAPEHRLSSRGAQAWLLLHAWDLARD